MHLTLISLSTPTFNNVRAASALPYHLILAAKSAFNAKIDVYSFNINDLDGMAIKQVEEKLGVKIHLLGKPRWIKWMTMSHLMFLRILFKYPLYSYFNLPRHCINDIKESNPDNIWIYGEELAGLTKFFSEFKSVVTMPDCESLYYYRMLRQPWATMKLRQIFKYSFAYWQYRCLERSISKENVTYHFVGKDDANFFQSMNIHTTSLFLRHPLYAYDIRKEINFHKPLIKLLFTGRYDFYCQHGSDEFLNELVQSELSSSYEITFLGKGWDKWNERLLNAGFISNHINFAPDFISELQKHDIQVNAIDVGTGTKGKVLDGIANGLLVIGTFYALENISVNDGESCVLVKNGIDFIKCLTTIKDNIPSYEAMAKKGRSQVLSEHNTNSIVKQLFS